MNVTVIHVKMEEYAWMASTCMSAAVPQAMRESTVRQVILDSSQFYCFDRNIHCVLEICSVPPQIQFHHIHGPYLPSTELYPTTPEPSLLSLVYPVMLCTT